MNPLALDIGGANLKAVWRSDSGIEARSDPFALWQQPAALGERLASLTRALTSPDEILLTMTAELCDCFSTKRQGVEHVLAAVESQWPRRPVRVWSTSGRFIGIDEARQRPLEVAAANWHALATWVAANHPEGVSILIDTGTTTTDILALEGGSVCCRGLTDTGRLAAGELVYLGGQRTPLMALGPRIALDGVEYHVMAEHFATMADVQVLRGALAEDDADIATADSRPRTRSFAAARILRMIGADLEMLDMAASQRLAEAFAGRAIDRLAQAVTQVVGGRTVSRVIISGSGGVLARAVAAQALPDSPRVLLADTLGPACAGAACAAALLALRESET